MSRRKTSKSALAGRVVEALTSAVGASPDNLKRLADTLGVKPEEVQGALGEAQKIATKTAKANSGSFAKGGRTGSPGPGRPPREVEVAYMQATMSRCSLDDWLEIVSRAVEDAKDGDRDARAWLAKQLGTEAPVRTKAEVEATHKGRLEVVFVDDWNPPLAEGSPSASDQDPAPGAPPGGGSRG